MFTTSKSYPAAALIAALFVPALCAQTDWPAYGHDQSGQRYSPLTKIDVRNVSKLRMAYAKVVHKTSTQLAAYWAKIIFTGDGRPPEILGSNAAVRKAVADNPNAIGYIDKSAVNKSVRVILAP